jgi:hypothetical protein
MPEINLPEVRLPELKLPEGLRDMTREDFVNAARDMRLPRMSDLLPDIDLSKIDLPKPIADRMPNRRRPNPILPIAAFLAIGAAIVAAWWLVTSSVTGPRIRGAVNDLKSRVTGESNGLVRYDNEADLGSLVVDTSDANGSSMPLSSYDTTNMSDLGEGVPVGPGEMPEGIRSN